jgi:hypothetical protein
MTRREEGDPLNVKTGRPRWQWLFVPRWVRMAEIKQKTQAERERRGYYGGNLSASAMMQTGCQRR